MKHISEINPGLASQTEPRKPLQPGERPRSDGDRARLDNLWYHMLSIYGDRWEAKYGAVPEGGPAHVWIEALRGLSDRQMKIGLRCCLLRDSAFAPTPGEFVVMVGENSAPAHRPFDRSKALAHQPSDEETTARNMAALRGMLGGSA